MLQVFSDQDAVNLKFHLLWLLPTHSHVVFVYPCLVAYFSCIMLTLVGKIFPCNKSHVMKSTVKLIRWNFSPIHQAIWQSLKELAVAFVETNYQPELLAFRRARTLADLSKPESWYPRRIGSSPGGREKSGKQLFFFVS